MTDTVEKVLLATVTRCDRPLCRAVGDSSATGTLL